MFRECFANIPVVLVSVVHRYILDVWCRIFMGSEPFDRMSRRSASATK